MQPGKISRPGLLMLAALVLGWGFPRPALAHSHVFRPLQEGCYAQPGELVKWQCFWGHPFEMLIDDAQPPKFFMFTPQRKKENLTAREITLQDQESGQDRKAFEVEYTPAAAGDYFLCLESPLYFIPEEKEFWQDYVKEPLHVQAAEGWDQAVGLPVEIIPLTRPYGWPAGSVFKGLVLVKNRPLSGSIIEVEKFNGFYVPRARLPKDRLGQENSPLITRVTKTDRRGYFICTLDSPGWWLISVYAPGGKKVYEHKTYPVEMRGGFWIYVEPPPPPLSPPEK